MHQHPRRPPSSLLPLDIIQVSECLEKSISAGRLLGQGFLLGLGLGLSLGLRLRLLWWFITISIIITLTFLLRVITLLVQQLAQASFVQTVIRVLHRLEDALDALRLQRVEMRLRVADAQVWDFS